jgi:hypothetical protein
MQVLHCMSLMDATNHVFPSATHIPGVKNAWVDLWPRSWNTDDSTLLSKILRANYEQAVVD